MITIEVYRAAQVRALLPQFQALLQDSVQGGASIGFLLPLENAQLVEFLEEVCSALERGTTLLLVALEEQRVIGMVMLALATKPNARHRAEVQKLMVHSTQRQRGIGRALMQQLESVARAHRRRLLVLDTREGDPSNQLYSSLGYQVAGQIPHYAEGLDGRLETTILYYKLLEL